MFASGGGPGTHWERGLKANTNCFLCIEAAEVIEGVTGGFKPGSLSRRELGSGAMLVRLLAS